MGKSIEGEISVFLRLASVFLALGLWQLLAMYVDLPILLVSPIQVAERLLVIWREEGFFRSIGFTMGHIAIGFFAGLIAGVILAVISHRFPVAKALFRPYLVAIRAVPVASFAVICLIWLSPDNISEFISFLMVLPVVYQNTLAGLSGIDPRMSELARVFRFSPAQRLMGVTLPALSPHLLAACRTSVGLSWKAGVAAEVIGTPQGSVGKALHTAKIYLDTEGLLAWTVVIVVISALSERMLMWVLGCVFGRDTNV